MKSHIWLTLISATFFGVSWQGILEFSSEAHTTEEKMPMQGMSHHHQKMEVQPGQAVPSVKLNVYPDAKKGWNLEVKVANFKFAPERVNTKSNTSEGHAHLYVDGKKLTRLYSSWYYLESLPTGKHKVSVTLNTNGHEDLTYQGKSIEASQIIEVK